MTAPYLGTSELRSAIAEQLEDINGYTLIESPFALREVDPATIKHLSFSVELKQQENTRKFRDVSGYGCFVRSYVDVVVAHRIRPNATGDQLSDLDSALALRDAIISQVMSLTWLGSILVKGEYTNSPAPELAANGAFVMLRSSFIFDHAIPLGA